MKKINDIKIQVIKDGVRVDDHILSYDFHTGVITYTDKESKVCWEKNGFDNIEIKYK